MELPLHAKVEAELRAILNRPAGSFIFHGLSGTGKVASAVWLAKQFNCLKPGHSSPCPNCALIVAGNYPDLILVDSGETARIGIGQIQDLQASLSLTPYYQQGSRVVIIKQADRLTPEAQNCLLKTIEEPPRRTLIVLTADSIDSLIETIRSRCAAVFFPRLSEEQITTYLVNSHIDQALAKKTARLSDGRVELATKLAHQPDSLRQREELEQQIDDLLETDNFQRLTRVARLADNLDLAALADSLAQRFKGQAREQADSSIEKRLMAIQRFKDHLAANVTPRAALESLVLKL